MESTVDLGPIRVYVGYDWDDPARYRAIKSWIGSAFKQVMSLGKKHVSKKPLSIQCCRMRAKHGGDLLASIIERTKNADVLVYDISGANPNVCLELGCALAARGTYEAGVFILQETSSDKGSPRVCASDLSGQLITYYFGDHLHDSNGFRAALVSALIGAARKRGMWMDRSEVCVEDDTPQSSQTK